MLVNFPYTLTNKTIKSNAFQPKEYSLKRILKDSNEKFIRFPKFTLWSSKNIIVIQSLCQDFLSLAGVTIKGGKIK